MSVYLRNAQLPMISGKFTSKLSQATIVYSLATRGMISYVSLLEKCTVANGIRLVHLKAISSYHCLFIGNKGDDKLCQFT